MSNTYLQVAFDNFHRLNEQPLNPVNWTPTTGDEGGPLAVVNNACYSGPSLLGGEVWTRQSFSNDQYSYCILGNIQNGEVDIAARISGGFNTNTQNIYYVAAQGFDSTFQLVKLVNGSYTSLGSVPVTFGIGDSVAIECVGSQITGFHNDSVVISVSDSAIPSGSAGLYIYPDTLQTDASVTLFKAGSISSGLPALGTLIGEFSGTSLTTAFYNPYSLDLVQVVNEGGTVVWNLSSSGLTSSFPVNPTSNALIGRYNGSSFSAAFPNPNNLDLLQVVGPGSKVQFFVNGSGFSSNTLVL